MQLIPIKGKLYVNEYKNVDNLLQALFSTQQYNKLQNKLLESLISTGLFIKYVSNTIYIYNSYNKICIWQLISLGSRYLTIKVVSSLHYINIKKNHYVT